MEPIQLNYTDQGSGKVLVLLHGYPLNARIWQPQVGALSQHCRVITPDLRGFGQSPATPGHYSMDLMAQDVLKTLDALGIERFVLAGHSMGGYVTLAAWRLAPQRIMGIGLVASQHLADTPEARENRYKAAAAVAEKGAEAVVGMVDKLFAEGTSGELKDTARQMILATAPNGIIGTLHAMATRPDSTETVKNITVPTVVIAGERDQIIKPEIARDAAMLIPNGTLAIIPEAGHMPMLEQPEHTTRALLDLVNRAQ